MIKFTKKLAIAASLVTLSAGYFDALASDGGGITPMELESPPVQRHALTSAVAPAEPTSEGVVQTAFFPLLTGRDMKGYLAQLMCEESSPFRLAQVCKAWYQFVMGRNVIVNKEQPISVDPFSQSSDLIQEIMNRWRAQKDLQILRNGTFRYQPQGEDAIDAPLAAMYIDDANGELALPADVAPYLCVTRNIKTFVKPDGDNTRKTLVLLLTLSELKGLAQQISPVASFLQNVSCADLSQNAVSALIRYGGDDLAKWGFRYTILKYREMSELSIWQVYTHEKAREAVAGWRALGGRVSAMGMFSFLNRN